MALVASATSRNARSAARLPRMVDLILRWAAWAASYAVAMAVVVAAAMWLVSLMPLWVRVGVIVWSV